ncbi:hypothetical protein BTR22_13870 [Alkalihalophilus pseudofirmus]|uniref:Uncharacterized protein n=1 Tax=Alkalihalophilus pseudofirmus TaxID=79885 RepID=A0AAJ2NMM4_ALKPS|nr:hypothetical protein [Alkalihalophilus pseudofirmus]MDV2884225.1 hypothetical protein [Alkalihalophilus pseudofirmus]OLS36068.1 hypothetical protein BTR22_13870 [Alkalihalophilus pseudofirmus]WEG18236.1 hypothetical protein PQ478_07065 [Alkalihalophilus pseudofirmus]
MNVWGNLLKKEIRLGVPAFIMPVAGFLIICAIAGFIGQRNGFMWEALIGVVVLAIGLQAFYLAYYMFFSLQAEHKKLHLWLHNPLPAYGLLSAKLAAGIISMVITTVIVAAVGLIAITQSELWGELSSYITFAQIAELGFYGGFTLYLFALSAVVWVMFFWMIFLLLSRVFHSFLSFVLTAISFIALFSFIGWFGNTSVHAALTEWGEIELGQMLQSIDFQTSLETGTDVTTQMGSLSFYTGTLLFETILALALFFIACWMLDRKVEV